MKKIIFLIFLFLNSIFFSENIDEIISIVDNEIITNSEFETYKKFYILQTTGGVPLPNERFESEIEGMIFDKLIDITIVRSSSDSLLSLIEREYIESEFNNILTNYAWLFLGESASVESFGQLMYENNIDWLLLKDLLKEEFESNLLTERYIARKYPELFRQQEIPEELLLEFYNEQLDSFYVPVIFDYSQILITPMVTMEKRLELNAKANAAIQAIYSGEDFRNIAVIYSDDEETKNQGGYLGIIDREDNELIPEMVDLIFSLEEGTIGFFESFDGVYIFYITQKLANKAKVYQIYFSLLPTFQDSLTATAKVDTVMELLKNGEDFSQVALNYSNDPFTKDGNVGEVYADSLDNSFVAILSMLKEGEYTKPIPSPMGYIILKLNKVINEPMEYSEIKENLQQLYLLNKRNKRIEEYLEMMQEKIYIERRYRTETN